MRNKELQEQRMKGYFIQATKDLLRSEGLKSVSVRSIAEQAGYSYATMYSYFKDVNDLVFLCVHDFYEECKQHVLDNARKNEKGLNSIKTSIHSYINFFVQYPGVFDLFFVEKISTAKDTTGVVQLINLSLDGCCEPDWNYCISNGIIKPEEAELLKGRTRNLVYGMLLMYMNRRSPASYTAFMGQLKLQLDSLFVVIGEEKATVVQNSLFNFRIGT